MVRPRVEVATAQESHGAVGDAPRMSIVLATAGRSDLLRRALPPLAAAVGRAPGTELVIVEQAGRDADTICAKTGIVAHVVPDAGRGASRARNMGTAHASGDV